MINSRQIVELIQIEIEQTNDQKIIGAYTKLIDRISVLEDNELNKMFEEYMEHEKREQVEATERRAKIEEQFKNVFGQ